MKVEEFEELLENEKRFFELVEKFKKEYVILREIKIIYTKKELKEILPYANAYIKAYDIKFPVLLAQGNGKLFLIDSNENVFFKSKYTDGEWVKLRDKSWL